MPSAGTEVALVASQEVALVEPDDAPSLLRRGPKILREGDPKPWGNPAFYDRYNRFFRFDPYCLCYHHYDNDGGVITGAPDILTALRLWGPLTLA